MENAHVVKNTIYAGQKYIPIKDGSKAHFHFQTWKLGRERVLIDDSRKIGKKEPMMLLIGHNFRLRVWETIVKMMSVAEVASFKVKKELLDSYPIVSKSLRELGQESDGKKHTCTTTLHSVGIGYPDLDDLINNPTDLEFIVEIIKVEEPAAYENELCQLTTTDDPVKLVPILKEKGNILYAQKLYDQAEEAYTKAISICEQLISETETDEAWTTLNDLKLPILLNFAQCKLLKGDYYAVIEHCNTILEHDSENEKALYRRGKAHVGAWNLDLAEQDFKQLKSIKPPLAVIIDKELDIIKKLCQEKKEEERNSMKKMFAAGNKSTQQ